MCSLVLMWFPYQLLRSRLFRCTLFISNFMLSLLSIQPCFGSSFQMSSWPREFENLQRQMTHHHLSLPNFLGGVGLISQLTFALTTFLKRKLSPYCLTLALKFVLNHHPLLLKVMAFVSVSYHNSHLL
jgi:hypothetical protein